MAAVLPADIGEIDGEIECSICTERFTDARFLSCHHTFCHDCLVEMDETERLTCPLCRQVTILPDNGVAGLRKNGLANLMAKTLRHASSTEVVQGKTVCQSLPIQHGSSNNGATFFCETCELAICGDCRMSDHRHPGLHKVVSIDQAKAHMKDKLVRLLEWGKDEVKRRNDAVATERKDVREGIAALKSQVQDFVSQEIQNITRMGDEIEKELVGIDTSIGKALAKSNDLEKNASLLHLNHLTEDIIDKANDTTLLEMHKVIYRGYEREKVPGPISHRLQIVSDFTSRIKFQRAKRADPAFTTIGRLTGQRDWMVLQNSFESYSLPSSLCAMSDGTVAVGFHGNESIRTYTQSCERCPEKDFESVAVKNMASSPSRDSLVVLDQNNDVSSMQNRDVKPALCVVSDSSASSESDHIHGGVRRILQHEDSDAIPRAIHTDAEGNILLLHEACISLHSPNGSLMRTVPFRDTPFQGESVQVRFQPSENLLSCGEHLRVLVSNERAIHLCQLAMDGSSLGIAWDINLPEDDYPGARRFGELDNEGNNVFIAYLRNNHVSIRMYSSVDHFESHEVVVDDLPVLVATSEVIRLAAASPDVLYMCTPEKLTVFRRETVQDFLQNNGLV